MNKRNKNKKTNAQKISDSVLEIPAIDIVSDKEASVWGTKGVIEYTRDLIRLNCGHLIVSFCGSDFNMKALSIEEVIITGTIFSIEFTNC